MCGCLSCALYWGPSPQPRHVPWLGIEPATPKSSQSSTQSTEPHQPGWKRILQLFRFRPFQLHSIQTQQWPTILWSFSDPHAFSSSHMIIFNSLFYRNSIHFSISACNFSSCFERNLKLSETNWQTYNLNCLCVCQVLCCSRCKGISMAHSPFPPHAPWSCLISYYFSCITA